MQTPEVKQEEATPSDEFEFPAPDDPMPDAPLEPELSFGANLAKEEDGPEVETGLKKGNIEVKMEETAQANGAAAGGKKEPKGDDEEARVKEERPNPKRQKVPLQETASAGWQVGPAFF